MAARVAPAQVQAKHQSLHHLVAKADWSDEAVLRVVRQQVLPAIERHGAIRAWISYDTAFPKKGVSGGFSPREPRAVVDRALTWAIAGRSW